MPLLVDGHWLRFGLMQGSILYEPVLAFEYAFVSIRCFSAAPLPVYVARLLHRLPSGEDHPVGASTVHVRTDIESGGAR